jgi:hypothetical protein
MNLIHSILEKTTANLWSLGIEKDRNIALLVFSGSACTFQSGTVALVVSMTEIETS